MPITKSAIKNNRQNIKRKERNVYVKSRMKTLIKNVLKTAKTNKQEAEKLLPKAYSIIDKALKKNLIHKHNAARKKSRIAIAASGMSK